MAGEGDGRREADRGGGGERRRGGGVRGRPGGACPGRRGRAGGDGRGRGDARRLLGAGGPVRSGPAGPRPRGRAGAWQGGEGEEGPERARWPGGGGEGPVPERAPPHALGPGADPAAGGVPVPVRDQVRHDERGGRAGAPDRGGVRLRQGGEGHGVDREHPRPAPGEGPGAPARARPCHRQAPCHGLHRRSAGGSRPGGPDAPARVAALATPPRGSPHMCPCPAVQPPARRSPGSGTGCGTCRRSSGGRRPRFC